jgi:enoyl-[acyl-carrier protein] reductase I
MCLLEGKKALIFGVANNKSIAWSIAKELHEAGAQLAFTYQGDRLESRVKALAEGVGSSMIMPCDVTQDKEIDAVFDLVNKEWNGLDILVHSIAFADKEELANPFVETSRSGFALAMDVSAYSLIALAKRAAPMMEGRDGSIITMTFYGSEKVFPNYNIMGTAKAALEANVRYLAADLGPMGIRVNAISAGPVKTLASMGIPNLRVMLDHTQKRAPLQRNVSAPEVAKTAVYLSSTMSSGVTGEIIYVDAGYNITGL